MRGVVEAVRHGSREQRAHKMPGRRIAAKLEINKKIPEKIFIGPEEMYFLPGRRIKKTIGSEKTPFVRFFENLPAARAETFPNRSEFLRAFRTKRNRVAGRAWSAADAAAIFPQGGVKICRELAEKGARLFHDKGVHGVRKEFLCCC